MASRGPERAPAAALFVLLALCLGLAVSPAAALAELVPDDEATAMYEPGTVVVIDLTLPQASIDALEEEPEEYQPGTFSLAFTDGSPDGVGPTSPPIEVGIRLKGRYGFRTLAGKAGFKLKLNQVKGQKFLGLKKMTLNSMVQDPSMAHEVLSYEVFRAVGVPASRTGYAFVRVNGESYGIYLNIETLDDVGLERWFGPFEDPQHLYEGEYGTDVTPGGAGAFEVDEGDEDDRSDLEALISAAAGDSAAFSARMGGLANLEELTRMWAVEKYVGHLDGYAGMEGPPLPNNFYLYSSASGEFQMLPWGTDQTWDERLDFGGDAGLLFDECLVDPSCRTLYRQALNEVGELVATLDLDSLARDTAALLLPWQQLEQLNTRHEYDLGEIADAVSDTRGFIAARPNDLAEWLKADLPDSPPPVAPLPAEAPARGALHVGRPAISAGTLTTSLIVHGAGAVGYRAEIRTVRGVVTVCSTRIQASGAGPLTVRCRLSAAARKRLSRRWLTLRINTQFVPAGGSPESVSHEIVVPKEPF